MHAQSSVSTVSSSVVLSGLSASLIVRRVCLVCRQVVIAICQNTLAAVEWQLRGSNPLSVSETSRASFYRCHVIVCQQKMESHVHTGCHVAAQGFEPSWCLARTHRMVGILCMSELAGYTSQGVSWGHSLDNDHLVFCIAVACDATLPMGSNC
jgi:hypothetical protein